MLNRTFLNLHDMKFLSNSNSEKKNVLKCKKEKRKKQILKGKV